VFYSVKSVRKFREVQFAANSRKALLSQCRNNMSLATV